jgi:phosphoenolpyruvate phosphomutase
MNAPDKLPVGFSRSLRLREMLQSNQLEFLMEAHNGLSARIVKEAGFKAIWGSGLSISAQYGVRDNNEASWTQVVDMLEFMADASDLPILLDGDTGYGNFNNVRRLVRKLEQRGIAGVCIEDKQFPKTNSFLNGERQPLAEMDEFCGKIKAGKDSQSDANFSIVARVEALIAGWGMEEALKRAEAYRRAGADAILIHSKLSKPDEILTFAREWAGRGPLVIVPTKYYSTPTDVFRQAGISTVIWANHLIRGATSAMQAIAKEIHDSETLVNVEDRVATVNEIFRLQDAD